MIFWMIRLILRLIFPVVIKSIFGKMQQSGGPQERPQSRREPEGSISINYMPPQPKTGNADKLGDFVDYEEVK
jgi:hypothetical protein